MTDVSRYWEIQHHPGQHHPFFVVCKSGHTGKILFAEQFPTVDLAQKAMNQLAQAEYQDKSSQVVVH